jgi:hypothetical protein
VKINNLSLILTEKKKEKLQNNKNAKMQKCKNAKMQKCKIKIKKN